MEAFLDVLGAVSLTLLVLVGLLSGFIASVIAGGHRLRYMVLGVAGAVALPFILAALGVGILAAGGLLVILAVALVGAVIVLAIARKLER
ncbi:GlsB/YeaQ/YmgE family stress response membrane protein [Roseivivax sp. CAU 1753]